jgi:hypothetical protein
MPFTAATENRCFDIYLLFHTVVSHFFAAHPNASALRRAIASVPEFSFRLARLSLSALQTVCCFFK